MQNSDNKQSEFRQPDLHKATVGGSAIRKGSGYLVETKFGIGRTYHKEPLINGKIPVFFEDGRKILFSEQNLKLIGFID